MSGRAESYFQPLKKHGVPTTDVLKRRWKLSKPTEAAASMFYTLLVWPHLQFPTTCKAGSCLHGGRAQMVGHGCLLGIRECRWGGVEIMTSSGQVYYLFFCKNFRLCTLYLWAAPGQKNKTCASSMLPFPLELKMGLGTAGYEREAGHAILLCCRWQAYWRAFEVFIWSSIQTLRTK